MTDEMDTNEREIRQKLRVYADAAVGGTAPDHREIARRAQARSVAGFPLGGLLVVVLVVAAVALLARLPVPTTGGSAPASSCAGGSWPATGISCDTVFRIGSQAGAQVDRARIWLTTLGAVKGSMHPSQQAIEPVETSEVWVIVYDGSWWCCTNAFDQKGNLIPQVHQTRWLVVAEAATAGAGYIYLQDWTGKAVPDLLPAP